MTLNDCIGLFKAKINMSISPTSSMQDCHTNSKLIGNTNKQSNSLVQTNKYNQVKILSDTTLHTDNPITH